MEVSGLNTFTNADLLNATSPHTMKHTLQLLRAGLHATLTIAFSPLRADEEGAFMVGGESHVEDFHVAINARGVSASFETMTAIDAEKLGAPTAPYSLRSLQGNYEDDRRSQMIHVVLQAHCSSARLSPAPQTRFDVRCTCSI